ncbi:MAG: chemotaxis protein CheW [Gemmatimonadaceae bacterium]
MTIRRLLVLEGGGSYYGIDTESVREVVPSRSTTRIPGAPPYVRGLLNLRGALVTVVDLAQRLGQESSVAAEPSVAVVQGGGRLLGLLVDDVLEVQELADDALTPSPSGGVAGDGTLVCGLGHFDGRVVLVVDVQELVRQTLA